jgi:ribonuclease BN (tRNA processing enzyme)
MLDDASRLHEMGDRFEIGPFDIETRWLPHWVPNAGVRVSAGGHAVAYTGDTGPSPLIAELARDADLLIAEASFPYLVPDEAAEFASSARQAGRDAARAGVGRLLLTHLWPGSDPAEFAAAAHENFSGKIGVATEPGAAVVTLGAHE